MIKAIKEGYKQVFTGLFIFILLSPPLLVFAVIATAVVKSIVTAVLWVW
jgi:hypothetical protein